MNKKTQDYELLDSGDGKKLERFGPVTLVRPASQAVWRPQKADSEWQKAAASFSREGRMRWNTRRPMPEEWTISIDGLSMKLCPTDFGHLGIFPEHQATWQWMEKKIRSALNGGRNSVSFLNLFAYSGAASLAAARAGAEVCHLDASKGMVGWAKDNAKLSGLANAPIRWIVDDAMKFLQREQRRGRRYDGILLDPPSFGRGARGEIFKIEEEIQGLLSACCGLLSEQPLFLILSCHTPGFTPQVLSNLLAESMTRFTGTIEADETILRGGESVFPLPSGTFARWSAA